MTNVRDHDAPILPGASVLPPMNGRRPPAPPKQPYADGDGRTPRKQHGRFGVLNALSDYGARLVDTTAQACWWIVFRETKPDGLARVSHSRIAECIGLSVRTVKRAMKRLERAGLLTVVRRGGLRDGASTYRVRGTPEPARPPPALGVSRDTRRGSNGAAPADTACSTWPARSTCCHRCRWTAGRTRTGRRRPGPTPVRLYQCLYRKPAMLVQAKQLLTKPAERPARTGCSQVTLMTRVVNG